jgi:hypothetical protein
MGDEGYMKKHLLVSKMFLKTTLNIFFERWLNEISYYATIFLPVFGLFQFNKTY